MASFLHYDWAIIDQALKAKDVSLSEADRLDLIEALWDSLAENDVPVTNAERTLLDARIVDADAHPEDERPWSEVRERLERRLRHGVVDAARPEVAPV